MRLCWRVVVVCALAGAARADVVPRAPAPPAPVQYGADGLAAIARAHRLRCGVTTAAEDYAMASTHGDLSAFGADLCRAVAAALLGGRDALSLTGYPDDAHGVQALRRGDIDLLFGVTPDAASALTYGIGFGPTVLFDGQGFMVRRDAGVTRPAQLAGRTLCFITGTSAAARMEDWAAAAGIHVIAHDFQERGEMDAALETGSCAAVTDDVSALAQVRASFHRDLAAFPILPELIAIDAWAPAMRAGEVRLDAVVRDVLAALIQGEVVGVTAQTAWVPHAGAAMLLGPTPGIAASLGMADGWARRAIAAGGNYGELYARDLGDHSAWRLPRGASALWRTGGMLAPPTLR